MKSKLNEGYKKMLLRGVQEVHMNDEIIAIRCDGYVLMNIRYREMIDGENIHPEHAFLKGWYRLPCADKTKVESAMTNLTNWAVAYRDRMIASGAQETDCNISVLIGGAIADLGRFDKMWPKDEVKIGRSGEHTKNNQSEK